MMQSDEQVLNRVNGSAGVENPMVSVWMISYNHEKFIAEAIEGVLRQKVDFKYELVIGEDGSADDTAKVIEDYARRYPDIIKPRFNKPNIGMMPNMIKTLEECKGKYIALCEGDDYWVDPLKLHMQVDFLEKNTDYVVCYHDAKIVDESGVVIKKSKLPEICRRDYSSVELMKGAWALTLSMVFRNVINKYPEEMVHVKNGDTFLSMLLGYYGKGKYLGGIKPAVYRQHQGGVWSMLHEEEKYYNGFNSRLYMYQYHLKMNGKEFAVDFLFEIVYPYFRELYQEKNPFSAQLRERDLREEKLRQRVKDIEKSYTYRVGLLLTRPLKACVKAFKFVFDVVRLKNND